MHDPDYEAKGITQEEANTLKSGQVIRWKSYASIPVWIKVKEVKENKITVVYKNGKSVDIGLNEVDEIGESGQKVDL